MQAPAAGPVKAGDRLLSRILLVVILIPVMLLILLFFAFSAYSAVPAGSTSVMTLPAEEYLQETKNPEAAQWLDTCGSDWDSAYALCYESEEGDQMTVQYLLYMPRLTEHPQVTSVGVRSGWFGFSRTLGLTMVDSAGNSGDTLLLVTCTGKTAPKLEIEFNGEKMACEVTRTDTPLEGDEAFREQHGELIYQQQIE